MYLETIREFKEFIKTLKIEEKEQLMILAGGDSAKYVEELINFLNDEKINFFGGIYAKLLIEKKHISKGFIIEKYEPVYTSIVNNNSDFDIDLKKIEGSTALVFVDGLTANMKDLMDTIYNKFRDKVKYLGGGAGFYDLKQRPCIFDNTGIHQDVAYICILKSKVELAVKHGWNKLTEPITITKAKDNTIFELEGLNAFDIYKKVISEKEKITFGKNNFFDYAKNYPFGVVKEGQNELIVRDPIAVTDEGELICIADIPEEGKAYILNGNANTLIDSSKEIAEYCAMNSPEKYTPFLFDCISRAMFLGERFKEELVNIQDKLAYPIIGALSIGEIASKTNGEIIVHNKSTIIGLLSK